MKLEDICEILRLYGIVKEYGLSNTTYTFWSIEGSEPFLNMLFYVRYNHNTNTLRFRSTTQYETTNKTIKNIDKEELCRKSEKFIREYEKYRDTDAAKRST